MGTGAARTIVDVLGHRARTQAGQTAFTFLPQGASALRSVETPAGGGARGDARALTFAQLDRRSRAIAARLSDAGLSGERALLLYPAGLQFVEAFFGCLYAGVVAVPAYPVRAGRTLDRLAGIAADASARVALCSSEDRPASMEIASERPALSGLRWLATAGETIAAAEAAGGIAAAQGIGAAYGIGTAQGTETAGGIEAAENGSPSARSVPMGSESAPRSGSRDPESIAYLQYTSGSTSDPKGVMVSHANLMANSEDIRRGFGHDEGSRSLCWLPHFHDMGLVDGIVQPVYSGFSAFLLSPTSFLQSPGRWLAAISEHRVTHSGGPNFAYDLCSRRVHPDPGKLDLRSWAVAYNGAEPVRAGTLERFAARFAACGFRSEAFYPAYGLAEATLKVSGGSLTGGSRSGGASIARVSRAGLEAGFAEDRARPGEGSAKGRPAGETASRARPSGRHAASADDLQPDGAASRQDLRRASRSPDTGGTLTGKGSGRSAKDLGGKDERGEAGKAGLGRNERTEAGSEERFLVEEGGQVALVGSGRPSPGSRVLILDPETGRARPENEIGEIWVSGPSVALGYWNRPEETERTFGARVPGEEGRFLRTGDLGFLRAGELFVTGRLKDLVIVRGRNIYPQDVELTAASCHDALRPEGGAAFGVEAGGEERLVVVLELGRRGARANGGQEGIARTSGGREHEALIDAVRAAIVETHEVDPWAVALVGPGGVPRTSSGKVQRAACRRAFLDGVLPVLAAWRAPEVRAEQREDAPTVDVARELAWRGGPEPDPLRWILERVAAKTGASPDTIDAATPPVRFGLDSLRSIELAHEIEQRFGAPLSPAELLAAPSLAAIAAHVRALSSSGVSSRSGGVPAGDPEPEECPLSAGQQGLFFLQEIAPESRAYTIAAALRLAGPLDEDALERAARALVGRHASLRSRLAAGAAGGRQRFDVPFRAIYSRGDLRGVREEALASRLADAAYEPFDLSRGPLFRVSLLAADATPDAQAGPGGVRILLVSAHHGVADLWSLSVVLRDLRSLYAAEIAGDRSPHGAGAAPRLAPAPHPAEFVRWQERLLQGAAGEAQLAYWREQLRGELPALDLPGDRPRPAVQSFRGGARVRSVDPALARALRALARSRGVTLYTLLLAAYQAFLGRVTGQNELLVGSPASGRTAARFADLVAYLVNPIVLRGELSSALSFDALLARTRERVLEALPAQDYPFANLVRRLAPERDASRSPLFDTMFDLHASGDLVRGDLAHPMTGTRAELAGGVVIEPLAVERRAAQCDLSLTVTDAGTDLSMELEYSTDLFDAATADRLARSFETLLAGVAADPASLVSRLPLLTSGERAGALRAANARPDPGPVACVHTLFEREAARQPQAVAVRHGRSYLTYGVLNRRANALAERLHAAGVRPESRVAVCLDKSLDLFVALMGVLKSGGAYVPVDTALPAARKRFLITDSGAAVVIGGAGLADALGTTVMSVEDGAWPIGATEERNAAGEETTSFPPPGAVSGSQQVPDAASAGVGRPDFDGGAKPENLAYVVYTSGTTGTPKGVGVTHASLCGAHRAWDRLYDLRSIGAHLQMAGPGFDVFTGDMVRALCSGGSLVLCDRETLLDPPALVSLIREHSVRFGDFVPTTVRELALHLARTGERLDSFPLVAIGADAWSMADHALFRKAFAPATRILNSYGVTESTVDSTCGRVEEEDEGRASPPIGRPLANTAAYVLDASLEPCPAGVRGELCLGGPPVARGYLGRPDLTAERFRPDPHGEPGSRLYRTGDAARRLADGRIEFLGRADGQVKVRGYRVEPAEIENAIRAHPRVRACAVAARERGGPREQPGPGDRRLVAYAVLDERAWPDAVAALREHAAGLLPDYMVPSAFVLLDELPVTSSGKVDRRALPEPDWEAGAGTGGSEPATPTEQALAGLWRQVLGITRVGAEDNFFALGGDSILAIQLVARARERGVGITPAMLFEHPTIAGLARAADRSGAVAAPAAARAGEATLTPIQRWFFEKEFVGANHWNLAVALDARRPLDAGLARRAARALVDHHEALRARFARGRSPDAPVSQGRSWDRWRQRIEPAGAEPDVVEVEAAAGESREEAVAKCAGRLGEGLDLERGPVVRFGIVRGERERSTTVRTAAETRRSATPPSAAATLVIVVHHLVADGVSLRILIEDFDRAYRQAERGEPIRLPGETAPAGQWGAALEEAVRAGRFDGEIDHWRRVAALEMPPLPDFTSWSTGARTRIETDGIAEPHGPVGEAEATSRAKVPPGAGAMTEAEEGMTARAATSAGQPADPGEPTDPGKRTGAGQPAGAGEPIGAGESTDPGKPTGAGQPTEATTEVLTASFEEQETVDLLRAATTVRGGVEDLLLAALASAWAWWSAGSPLYVELEGHGRDAPLALDVSRTVGWFTESHPILVEPFETSDDAAALDAVAGAKDAASGGGLGALRSYSPDPRVRDLLAGVRPPDISFNYLGRFDATLGAASLFERLFEPAASARSPFARRPHALEIDASIVGGRLSMRWSFSRAQLEASALATLVDGFREALGSIVAARSGARLADRPQAGVSAAVVDDVLPLTPMQEGMLFHHLRAREDPYVSQIALTLAGDVDRDALARAWKLAVAAHPALRAEFAWRGVESPVQIIRGDVALPVTIHDGAQVALEDVMACAREKGFDVSRAPLARVDLVRMGERETAAVFTHHHLLLDGWSLPIVLASVFEAYEAIVAGRRAPRPPDSSLRAYVEWVRSRDPGEAERFFRDVLAGFATPTPLPDPGGALLGACASTRPPGSRAGADASGFSEIHERGEARGVARDAASRTGSLVSDAARPQSRSGVVSASGPEGAEGRARALGLTPNTVVQAAWALVLAASSGERDVVFGATSSGRPPEVAGIESLVGLCINTLPVRVKVDPEARVREWMLRLQSRAAELRQHESASLALVQRCAAIPPNTSLFDSLLVFENYPLDLRALGRRERFAVSGVRLHEETNYPLTIVATYEDGMRFRAIYDRSRFDEPAVRLVLERLGTAIEGLLANPDAPLGEVSVLGSEERARSVEIWNRTRRDYPREATIAEIFERVAAERARETALVWDGGSATYGELGELTLKVARALRARGVGLESRIALAMERSPALIAAILGVLRAGGAYVPLDPDSPPARTARMLGDSGASLLVTDLLTEALLARLEGAGPSSGPATVSFERLLESTGLDAAPLPRARAENLAYVMFTSGSTGQPKGTEVTNRNVLRLVFGADYVRFGPEQTVFQLSAAAFDLSTFEIWGALLHGGRLAIAPPRLSSAAEIARCLKEFGVTLVWLTAGLFDVVVDEELEALARVPQVLAGGDAVSPSRVRRLLAAGCRRFVDGYGPTETTTFACCQPLGPGDEVGERVPIGPPIANTRVYVVDGRMRPVPIGAPGELCVGDDGVSRGYARRPDLTAERFVPDPFGPPGSRLYCTGDVARWMASGRIDFLGRRDGQLKVRGFRVEIGEVEAALAEGPGVRAAAVVARGRGGDVELVGYVVPEPGSACGGGLLRASLAGRLPRYMIPSRFVFLDALPLTASGKVDRRNLPDPVRVEGGAPPPRACTPVEGAVADLWRRVLGVEVIGPDDDFFELGGHSLHAMRLLGAVRRAFRVELPMAVLFEATTVSGLARALVAHQPAPGHVERAAGILSRLRGMSDEERRQALGKARSAGETA